MPEQGNEPDDMNSVLEELKAIRQLLQDRLPAPPSPTFPTPDEATVLKNRTIEVAEREATEFPGRRALMREIERQSDIGPIDVDQLLRGYHKEYREPVRMLLQDLQQRAEIYHNAFEQLKQSTHPETAARDLRNRYLALGLIEQQSAWPNPWGWGAMDYVNKKLDRLREAILKLLRAETPSLLHELNFDSTINVGVEFALSLSGPQVTITLQQKSAPDRPAIR